MSEAKTAWARAWRDFRAGLCEQLCIWALQVKPDDYTPIVIGHTMEIAHQRGYDQGWRESSKARQSPM